MQLTPLLRKLKSGYFLAFQSAGNDITSTFNNSNSKFRFSKFALLNLPPIQTPVNNANNIQFAAIEGAFTNGLSPASPPPEGDRIDFSENLQNYLLNLEALISSSNNFDSTQRRTIAERIFFKKPRENL